MHVVAHIPHPRGPQAQVLLVCGTWADVGAAVQAAGDAGWRSEAVVRRGPARWELTVRRIG